MLSPSISFDDFAKMKPLSPKARASIKADGWMTVWEGAIRSGKTVASILAWLMYLRNTSEKVFFMSGKTYGSLIRNVVEGDFGILALGAPDVEITKDRTGSNVLLVGDKKVYLFGASDDGAYLRLKGLTAGGWYADEIATQPESFIVEALSRTAVSSDRRIFWTLNPTFPSHYIYAKFLDRWEGTKGYRRYHCITLLLCRQKRIGTDCVRICGIRQGFVGLCTSTRTTDPPRQLLGGKDGSVNESNGLRINTDYALIVGRIEIADNSLTLNAFVIRLRLNEIARGLFRGDVGSIVNQDVETMHLKRVKESRVVRNARLAVRAASQRNASIDGKRTSSRPVDVVVRHKTRDRGNDLRIDRLPVEEGLHNVVRGSASRNHDREAVSERSDVLRRCREVAEGRSGFRGAIHAARKRPCFIYASKIHRCRFNNEPDFKPPARPFAPLLTAVAALPTDEAAFPAAPLMATDRADASRSCLDALICALNVEIADYEWRGKTDRGEVDNDT